MRRPLVIAGAALGIALVAVLLVAALAPPTTSAPQEPLTDDHRDRRISFEGYDSGVWPYLSSEPSFRRTSPVNVVVKGEPEAVVDILRGEDGDFRNLTGDEREATAGEEVFGDPQANGSRPENLAPAWEATEGATRYAYLEDGNGGGTWSTETAQLQDGTYYGHRHHIRIYASPSEDEPWVAMQAHSEHFNWFTLRHEVHGTQRAQERIESVFLDDPRVQNVWRAYVANDDSSDSDGWASMVVLAGALAAPLGLALAGRRRRRHTRPGDALHARRDPAGVEQSGGRVDEFLQRHLTPVDRRRLRAARERLNVRTLGLAAAIVTIVLGVRFGGVALEQHASGLSMHAIAAILYPFMGLGIPVATYAIASGIERRMDAAVAASTGFAVGILADYTYLGVDVIPIATLLQRLAVIFALGLVAAGAARRATRQRRLNELLIVGGVLWIVFQAATLLGYL